MTAPCCNYIKYSTCTYIETKYLYNHVQNLQIKFIIQQNLILYIESINKISIESCMFSKLNVASDLSKIGKFLMEVEGNCVA